MEPVVRYAAREDLPRVNELRQQVSELHAAGRPDIFRPGFCEALQQHVYQLFDAPEFDVLVACVGETICGFAAYVNRPGLRICAPAASTTLKNSRHGVAPVLPGGSRTPGLLTGLELDVWFE